MAGRSNGALGSGRTQGRFEGLFWSEALVIFSKNEFTRARFLWRSLLIGILGTLTGVLSSVRSIVTGAAEGPDLTVADKLAGLRCSRLVAAVAGASLEVLGTADAGVPSEPLVTAEAGLPLEADREMFVAGIGGLAEGRETFGLDRSLDPVAARATLFALTFLWIEVPRSSSLLSSEITCQSRMHADTWARHDEPIKIELSAMSAEAGPSAGSGGGSSIGSVAGRVLAMSSLGWSSKPMYWSIKPLS